MTASLHLIALRDLLSAETGQAVAIGPPTDEGRGLCLWSWKLDLLVSQRNTPPAPPGDPRESQPSDLLMSVHFLLFPLGGSDVERLDALDVAGRVIQANPVLGATDSRGRVLIETISTTELTAIFVAAGLPLRLCLGYRLESVA